MLNKVYVVTTGEYPSLSVLMETVNEVAKDRGWKPGDADGWDMSEDLNFADAAAQYGLMWMSNGIQGVAYAPSFPRDEAIRLMED